MDKLEEIMAAKRQSLEHRIRPVKTSELEALARSNHSERSFLEALARPDRLSVIAEIKRKSPSAGAIAESANAVEQARIYQNAEADALSILTDTDYFGGHLNDLWDVVDFLRQHKKSTPCLRKDFMLHPIQVLEAVEAGASCILIIVRALSRDAILALKEAADCAQLDILYEIHDERELEEALSYDPKIIGVNNRDLTRFQTDLTHSEDLIPQIPEGIVTISESGIFTPEDAARARECGADAILVGEALMRTEDPEALIEAFHAL
ncbi:MAG: indole-3-glycerol phosphate synthase [Puniceicoccaceae bacterium]|nr:indole-3-glycerol phosphate synthase [Puniceicoccaceae bacterium]